MMPINEENKELRELVAETLKAKGVLGKVQAQIRASVFLALEEQDVFKDKSPFFNKPLKDFLKSPDGLMVISLVKEFMDFFNLEFTTMVFDPETHAGIDYNYEGRSKLEKDLQMESCPEKLPLLAHVLAQSKLTSSNTTKAGEADGEILRTSSQSKDSLQRPSFSEFNSTNNINGGFDHNRQDVKHDDRQSLSSGNYSKNVPYKNDNSRTKDLNSLTSLSNLPPINNKSATLSNSKGTELKSIIDLGLDHKLDTNFDDENSKQIMNSSNGNSGGDDSEIEEEIPTHNSNASGATALSMRKMSEEWKPPCDESVNKASVSEELKKLKALTLTFVKDVPLKLVDCHTAIENSVEGMSELSSGLSVIKEIINEDTISEIEDISELSFSSSLNPDDPNTL